MFDRFKRKFNNKDLKTYGKNLEVLDELKNAPNLVSLLYKMREIHIKRAFGLSGDEALIEKGKVLVLNELLDIDVTIKRAISTFKQIAQDEETDISEEYSNYINS